MRGDRSIRGSSTLLLLLLLHPLSAAGAFIDKITIEDGSVLKGEIKRVEDDELVLDTDYADDVVIDVEHIVDIESKQQFSVRLINGEIISGFLTVSQGKIVLRENLPPPGESNAPEASKEIEFAAPSSQALSTTSDTGVDGVVQQASTTGDDQPEPTLPTAESQPQQTPPIAENQPQQTSQTAEAPLQQATPDDLLHDQAPGEAVQPPDEELFDIPSVPLPPSGRQFSFDDVDWIREKPTYFRYDAELNVATQWARGNTDTTDLHFDARFEPSFGWNTIRISGLYDKKVADGDTTTNRWKASLVYERDFRRRWYVGAANTYESDSQRDLDLRVIFAGGVGYRFFDEDPTHFSVLPALAYVRENFEEFVDPITGNKFSDDTNYVAFQLSMDFERDLYNDDITFFHNNMYLSNLQSLSDIIIETQTGIKFDMAWDLVLTAEVETHWENEPAEDADKLDTRYMLKIGFEFEGDEDDWFH